MPRHKERIRPTPRIRATDEGGSDGASFTLAVDAPRTVGSRPRCAGPNPMTESPEISFFQGQVHNLTSHSASHDGPRSEADLLAPLIRIARPDTTRTTLDLIR
jgi:hypothetical protein